MSESAIKLNLIVAACKNGGIGVNGKLPWNLKDDMAFFRRITSTTSNKEKQNAVIMGRKTWDSIPDAMKPLKGRINVVISGSWNASPSNVVLARDMNSAVDLLSTPPLSEKVENIFVIGGHSIYKMAFDSPFCHRVYMTHVLNDFECDTFFPQMDPVVFKPTSVPDISNEEKEESNIKYQFQVYEKYLPNT